MRYKILIVEDDPMVRSLNEQYLRRIIAREKLVLYSVDDASKALEVLKVEPIDLILLDIYMPKQSGDQLLKKLQQMNKHPQVIMLTAASDAGQVGNALNYGVLDYLVKPFTYERFRDAIQKYIKYSEVVGVQVKYSQTELDKLFSTTSTETSESELPKGLSPFSLEKIEKVIDGFTEPFSNQEVAEKIKLSRISTKKYLDYLLDAGKISSSIKYLKIGRPVTMYEKNETK